MLSRESILLTSTKARSFAETTWGRGGTTGYRTNRKGAYYYSCSGHGGYVVDGNALTPEEKALILQHHTPDIVTTVITDGKLTFMANPGSVRSQRYRYTSSSLVFKHEIFFFEEDCDWAVLEKFTNIRAQGYKNPVTHEEAIEPCFQRWHGEGRTQQQSA